eukprot:CAMPEP_0171816952 /NCGR_PEP_ID=MMETSP0992-20121227/813_1 /TAXON_ID=483369 /ORGANISM="non described non described, Strain CCMP2098" /LENGTH=76 /DNA_ID=CAMNT_0012430921 /DNA_START=2332 /DNA_END=2561 /DNA_ORIENTATION=-
MAWATPPPLLSRALHLTVDIDTFDSRNSARIAASSVCAVISVRASVASFGFSTSVMTSRGGLALDAVSASRVAQVL